MSVKLENKMNKQGSFDDMNHLINERKINIVRPSIRSHIRGRDEKIHPELHPVVFVDGEHEIITRSTKKSNETRTIDGVEHYVLPIDISAYTHPFFTGKERMLDTEGRVERFRRRFGQRGK